MADSPGSTSNSAIAPSDAKWERKTLEVEATEYAAFTRVCDRLGVLYRTGLYQALEAWVRKQEERLKE